MPESAQFKKNAQRQLNNTGLQANLQRFGQRFAKARAIAIAELEDFSGLRQRATAWRDLTLANLDDWLIRFETHAQRMGTQVHWATTAAEVNQIVLEIAHKNKVRKVIKSKSMVSEETGLNAALQQSGIDTIETDLGEYILQLAGEPPSHLVAPALHKNVEEVADLFQEHHHTPRQTDIPTLCREARHQLRPHFLSADMGISGGNFLVADTGALVLLTNEGNARLVTTLPRVHVAITGIEKVIPSLDALAPLLRLLPRSATGQSITNDVSLLTGPRRPGDLEGPEEHHVILVDGGRSELLGSELQPALRCIRCGACMNHCPVYQNIGGHAYGWVYPGPIGAVLTPAYLGLEHARDLPQAATLCGACEVVCPVSIPLPDLLRVWRQRSVSRGLRPWPERVLLRLWLWCAMHPLLYRWIHRRLSWLLRQLANDSGQITYFPGLTDWTQGRNLKAPDQPPFHAQWAQRHRS
jgi:Uncharacterized conserved protein containing a ferredoxin-like domain